MKFFCGPAEFDQYVREQELDPSLIIKCDAKKALREAREIFLCQGPEERWKNPKKPGSTVF